MEPTTNTIVLKIGGSLRGSHMAAVISAMFTAESRGYRVVVVHGGGPRITEALTAAGIANQFMNGLRVTSAAAMQVIDNVLGRELNQHIVTRFNEAGLCSTSVSYEAGVLHARPLSVHNRTGEIVDVNTEPIVALMRRGCIPVIAPIGLDDTGSHCNINADLAAAAIAGALHASRVVFLTDVPGIYEDWQTKALLSETSASYLEELLSAGRFTSGMIPKVQSVLAALRAGVMHAFVVDGRDAEAVRFAAASPCVDGGYRPKSLIYSHIQRSVSATSIVFA